MGEFDQIGKEAIALQCKVEFDNEFESVIGKPFFLEFDLSRNFAIRVPVKLKYRGYCW